MRTRTRRHEKISNILAVFVVVIVIVLLALDIYLPRRSQREHWAKSAAEIQSKLPLLKGIEKAFCTSIREIPARGLDWSKPLPVVMIGLAQVDLATMDSLVEMGVTPCADGTLQSLALAALTDAGLTSRDSTSERGVLEHIDMDLRSFDITPELSHWELADGALTAIKQQTTFHSGEMFLNRQSRMVYFRLVADEQPTAP